MADTVIFLTSGTSFTRPADYNNAANKWEAIGAGGDSSVALGGRPGGCYAKITNFTCPQTLTYQVGVHGGTTGSGTAPTSNSWIKDASTLVAPGIDSTTTNCVGSTVFAGGAGGGVGNGGGGAGGLNAAGNANSGTTGGKGDGTFGGAGGTPGNPGNPGVAGAEWTSNPGGVSAGSGGGGGANNVAGAGGAGGLYGGGAGADVSSGTANGGGGIIVITYTPLGLGWETADFTAPSRRKYRQLDETASPLPPPGPGVPGVCLWLDASDSSTITSSAGAVSAWLDKSGNGVNATQATGTKQPTLIANTPTGKNAIRFTSANLQEFGLSRPVNSDPNFTLFTIAKRLSTATQEIILSSTNHAIFNRIDAAGTIYISNNLGDWTGSPPLDANYDLITSQVSNAAGTCRYNGSVVTLSFGSRVTTGAIWNNIGNFNSGTYSDATVAEIILYPRLLTAAEIAIVEKYLTAKWLTPTLGWETADVTAPCKKKYKGFDEVVVAPLLPPVPPVTPNFGWNDNYTVAPIKKKYRQLDEVIQAPSATGLPPVSPSGWVTHDFIAPRRKKYQVLDETILVPNPLGLPAPPSGWLTRDETPRIKRIYRPLDETAQPLRTVAGGPIGPHDLTDTLGFPLTDTAGVHLTDVFSSTPAPNFGWNASDNPTQPKKKFRSLDETVQAPSSTGLPAVVNPPTAYWLTVDETAPVKRRYRQLDEVVQAPSPFGLPSLSQVVIFLTSGTSFNRPGDWNDANNSIEAIGAGGDSAGTTGATAGCYAKIVNYTLPATFTYQIGTHGGTVGAGTGPTANTWGTNASTIVAAGAASATTNCVGSTVFAGGTGGVGHGGGGAAGPNGAGGSASGTAGAQGDNGFGGAGGAAGNPPTAGSNGTEWTSNPGGALAGSGGGGGKAQTAPQAGGAGGLYGGAAGGRFTSGTGVGANGIIVLTYSPVGTAPLFGWATSDDTAPKRRKYQQLDEAVQAPSATGLPPSTPNSGWNVSDGQSAPRKTRARFEDAQTLFPPATVPTPSTFWLTNDETAPRKRKFVSLDEAVKPLFPPPFIVTLPTSYWLTADETAPRKRRYQQLDEIVQPIFQTFDCTSFGMWFIGADASISSAFQETARKPLGRFRRLDNDEFIPKPIAAPPPILFGWNETDRPGGPRRRYGRLDEIAAAPFGLLIQSFGWATPDEIKPARRKLRPLEALEWIPSPLGLPAPPFGWNAADAGSPRRKWSKSLDTTSEGLSALGLPAQPTTNFGWNASDYIRPRRYKFVQLDETVITLTLPPGLPVPVPQPPPSGHTRIIDLNASFVFGPNTPQLGDLAVAVLQDLGVLESGQPVASEDAMTIINRLFPKLEELNERDVAFIDADNISNAQFLPLVKIMAYECASAFTITDPTKLSWLQSKGGKDGEAEGTLKDIVRLRTPRQTMRVETFTRPRWWN